MDRGIRTFTVTFQLIATPKVGEPQRQTFVNTIVAVDPDVARTLGEKIANTTAASMLFTGQVWSVDPTSIGVVALDADDLGAAGPLLAAIEEEMMHGQNIQRVLAAAVARYGPIELDARDLDAAVPGAVTMVANGDTVWWILPHQLHLPFAFKALPPLPKNGMVDGIDLGRHIGREVLVSTADDPGTQVPASRWAWRMILGIESHQDGPTWRTLVTDAGAQTIVTAGAYSVRNPRPVPVAVELGEDRDDG